MTLSDPPVEASIRTFDRIGRVVRELTTLAEQVIKRRLENARGVGRVTVVGGMRREIRVNLKPAEMEALRARGRAAGG